MTATAATDHALTTWGRRIRDRRTHLGLSRDELAGLDATSQSAVSQIENGRYPGLTVALMIDLAVALDTEPADLFAWPTGLLEIAGER